MNRSDRTNVSQQECSFIGCTGQLQQSGALLTLNISTSITKSSDEVLKSKTDLIAALYGLGFKVKPLIMNTLRESKNISRQLLWVEHTDQIKADEFVIKLTKIIHYFAMDLFCMIHIDHEQAQIRISQQQQQTLYNIATNQLEQYLQEKFYTVCLPSFYQKYSIEIDHDYSNMLEPQTNLGKVARDIRIKSIFEKMK
jgi:hypothetical protein